MASAREGRCLEVGPPGSPVEFSADGRDLLICGDVLSTAATIRPGSLALVYLDPPFGTGRPQPYRAGLSGKEKALDDRADPEAWWSHWGPRIDALSRTLRPGGILVIHLDPRLAPRVRVSLDARLGPANLVNEIVWHYRSGGIARDRFAAKHDTLIVYRTAAGHTFHRQTEKRLLAHRVRRAGVDEFREGGRWYRHALMDDVWEIGHIPPDARERLGYPTQKPESLVERLLSAFTDPGESVTDLACGSGTLPAVARRLGRRWIAGDRDPRAIVCTAGRIARAITPELLARWNDAGVMGRRGDLAKRLERWRRAPSSWGLSESELLVTRGENAVAPGFCIAWEEGAI